MTKQILVLLLIALVAFAQPHSRTARREDGKLSGGFHRTDDQQATQLRQTGHFMQVEKAARDFYSLHTGKALGTLISIDKQIVSGINFKITFEATPEITDQTVVITVFSQPWTKTIEVTNVLPPIDGVTDSTGKVVTDTASN